MRKLLFILFLIPALSFGQSISTQYNQGKQRVSDSIGFYPTFPNHYIDKITTAGCWWNLWDFTLNVYDSLSFNSGILLPQLNDSLAHYLPLWQAAATYQPILAYTPENVANKVTSFASPNNTTYPTTAAVNSALVPYLLSSTAAATYQPIGSYGSVSSIATGYGLSGGTITTTGTLIADTTKVIPFTDTLAGNRRITTPAYINSQNYLKANQTVTLSGDITGSGATAITTTLKNTGTAGTYGSSTLVPVITTDAQGRVTAITTTSITTGGTGTVTSVTAGAGLSGGTITGSGTISMPNVGTAGTYGGATQAVTITTDAQGRISGVTTANMFPITVASANLTGQTSTGTILTYTPASTGTFELGGYFNSTIILSTAIVYQMSFTDENSNIVTRPLPLLNPNGGNSLVGTIGTASAPSFGSFILQTIRVKGGTTITISSVNTISSGQFDIGAWIRQDN